MAAQRFILRRRHSEQFKALVLKQCAMPGASVAKVAYLHGVSATMVHGWRKVARERDGVAVSPPRLAASPVRSAASLPQFVPVSMAQTASPPACGDIQIELQRGATAMKLTWPVAAASEYAAWLRELLMESRLEPRLESRLESRR